MHREREREREREGERERRGGHYSFHRQWCHPCIMRYSLARRKIYFFLVNVVYFLSYWPFVYFLCYLLSIFLLSHCPSLSLSLFNISFCPSPYYYSFSSLLSFYSFSVPSPSLSLSLSLSSHFISCSPLFPCHSRCCMHTKEPSLLNDHERRVYLKIWSPWPGNGDFSMWVLYSRLGR